MSRASSGWRIAATLLTAVVAGLAAAAGSSPLADSGSSENAPGEHQFDDPRIKQGRQEGRDEERRRKEKRKTAEEKEARRRSRTAYRDKSRREAVDIAKAKQGKVLHDPVWKPLPLRPGDHVAKYLSLYGALVDVGDDKQLLAESDLPLRATPGQDELAPISLELEDRGDAFAPENPLIETRIGKAVRDGISFVRGDFSFRLATDKAGDEPLVTNDRAFFANAETDTDLIVTPTPTGVETFLQLRSAASPESATLDFELPHGARLRFLDERAGSVEVVRGDEQLALIQPPVAWDTDEERVPVSVELAGDRLKLDFPHRNGDFAYPIMVDPIVGDTVKENWNLDGNGIRTCYPVSSNTCPNATFDDWAWTYSAPNSSYFQHYQSQDDSNRGLTVWGYKGTSYTDGWYGEYYWQAKRGGVVIPTAYIERADFGYVTHNRANSCVIEGIFAPTRNNWDWGTWRDRYGAHGSSPTLRSGEACRDDLNANYKSHCVGNDSAPNNASCVPGDPPSDPTGTPKNEMVFGMLINQTGVLADFPSARMEGATMWLYDTDVPTITSPPPPSSWVDDGGSLTTSVAASDAGLGMHAFNLFLPSGAVAKWVTQSGGLVANSSSACAGDRTARCPQSASGSYTYSLPEGVSSPVLAAYDALSKATGQNWTLKIDRSAPSITTSGRLRDLANKDLFNETYQLHIDAADGSPGSSSTARSGVRSLEVLVDNLQQASWTQDCPSGSCSMAKDWSFVVDQYDYGDHQITVRATDQLGHVATSQWMVTIADEDPLRTEQQVYDDSIEFRREFGLNDDPGYVHGLVNEPYRAAREEFGVPLTSPEVADIQTDDETEDAEAPIDDYGRQQASADYAGMYQGNHGLVYAGFVRNGEQHLEELKQIFPYPDRLRLFEPPHTATELETIFDAVEALMDVDTDITMVAVDYEGNVVEVGFTDVASPTAAGLVNQYGSAIRIVQSQPTEARKNRTNTWDPVLAGVRIFKRLDDGNFRPCTAGFMFQAGDPPDSPFPQRYSGVITAGHCIVSPYDGEWRQGSDKLGDTRQNVWEDGSRADAGTISVSNVPVAYRDVSNRIYITSKTTQSVEAVQNENKDRQGQRVCMSGQRSGVKCGKLRRVSVTIRYSGKRVKSQRRASFGCGEGDSGAPTYRGRLAKGIVAAYDRANQTSPGAGHPCYYSHVGHVQQRLDIYIKR